MVTKHQMKKDQSIPINKGNYSMDTEERLQLFEKNRSDFIPGVASVPPHADPDGEVRWHDRQTPLRRV